MFEEQVLAINKIKSQIYNQVENNKKVGVNQEQLKSSFDRLIDQFYKQIPHVNDKQTTHELEDNQSSDIPKPRVEKSIEEPVPQ